MWMYTLINVCDLYTVTANCSSEWETFCYSQHRQSVCFASGSLGARVVLGKLMVFGVANRVQNLSDCELHSFLENWSLRENIKRGKMLFILTF
jgi:hypothetical protein